MEQLKLSASNLLSSQTEIASSPFSDYVRENPVASIVVAAATLPLAARLLFRSGTQLAEKKLGTALSEEGALAIAQCESALAVELPLSTKVASNLSHADPLRADCRSLFCLPSLELSAARPSEKALAAIIQSPESPVFSKINDTTSIAFKAAGYDLKIASTASRDPMLSISSGGKLYTAEFDLSASRWSQTLSAEMPSAEVQFGTQLQSRDWHELKGEGFDLFLTQYSNKGLLVDIKVAGESLGRARLDLFTGKWNFSN